jgi:hypothetical protein
VDHHDQSRRLDIASVGGHNGVGPPTPLARSVRSVEQGLTSLVL